MKKLISVLTILLVSLSLFSMSVLAKEGHGKESLVALGDSIAFGFNLEKHNQRPSRDAFPYIIGEEADLRVRNLAVPGATTVDLLTALETDKYRDAIKHADYITLSIGSNDLLGALNTNPTGILEFATGTLLKNLTDIIAEIRKVSDAEIIVYNIYNPFQLNNPDYVLGASLLPLLNVGVYGFLGSYEGITVVDAYSVIQPGDILPNDIHPNWTGQEDLAEIGISAIMQ